MNGLYYTEHRCCSDFALAEDEPLVRLDEDTTERILRRIASEGFDPRKDLDPDLFEHTFGALNNAIDRGFGAVEYGDPDFEFVQQLKYNNAVFSAFKTHRQGNDLRSQLFDSEGRVRSFAQFRKASEPILGDYNVRWLQTEYNTTLVRATHTAHWLEMEREKDLYPNLEWMASTAAHPREAHKAFYGLILPMEDVFWTTHYPGNVWGCLCGIRSTSGEPTGRAARRSALRNALKPAPGLDVNPVQSGAIYSFSHPYFTAGYPAYKKLKPIAERFARKVMFKYTDSKVQKAKQTIDKYRGRDVLSENLHTGSVKFLRRTYKDVKTHNTDHRVLLHPCDPEKAVKRWKYIGRKEVGLYPEGHKLAGQRKHPEAEYFAYYEVKIGGRIRYVHTKFSRKFQTEIPYVITDHINLKGIRKKEP